MPTQILARERPTAFIDVVAKRTTYAFICDLLKFYSDQTNVAWDAVAKRLHWIAVLPTSEGLEEEPWKPSDSAWTSEFDSTRITTIDINTGLWFYLADWQIKTTNFYPPTHWGDSSSAKPPPKNWDWLTYAARGSREMYRRGERSRVPLAKWIGESPEPLDAIKLLVKELRQEAR